MIENIRHSCAHLLAAAIKNLHPKTKFGIGPVIENGFYYDIDLEEKLTPEDLPMIEDEMKKIKNSNLLITGQVMTAAKAKSLFKKLNQPYKLELLKELEKSKGQIKVYSLGDFIDLCKGGHVKNTKEIGPFKLTSVAGAYWRGDEKNKMLTRVYGIAFKTQKELDAYLKQEEEAKKRDHRILGQELDLFSFHDVSPGSVFWHPNGNFIKNTLIQYLRNVLDHQGYQEISTPLILSEHLWLKSGHWDHYKSNMYFTKVDERDFAVKPMNCPGAALIFKNKVRSYRDLPLRLAEFGMVHRHELSGTLHGLFRVRAFTQDDAHIFCESSQVKQEIEDMIILTQKVYNDFGFKDYRVELSTRPEKFMGSIKVWDLAEKTLEDALRKSKIKYALNKGDGAFYGPKIDFHIKDSIGRSWQCGTIQLDFQMPERFDLGYFDKKGAKERPAMIHRVIFGALERFIGILIEHYAGVLPLWLSPAQINISTVGETHIDSAKKLALILTENKLRVELDISNNTVGHKIRQTEIRRMPLTIVIGDKEKNLKKLALRKHGDKKIELVTPKQLLDYVRSKTPS